MLKKIFDKLFEREPKWWEKEAEEQGMTVEQYLNLYKLEKENVEISYAFMMQKEEKRSRREKWDDYQAEQFEAEKEKNKGYEQLAKVHSAYISILLKKLGATDSNTAISLTQAEVKEALEKNEARATIDNTAKTYKLYCAAVE